MKKIVLFTMQNCPHCIKAQQYLEQNKIAYRSCNVKSQVGKKEFYKTGYRSVPVLKVGDQFLTGFNVKSFKQFIKED